MSRLKAAVNDDDAWIDDIVARINAPGGYEAFEEAVKRAGCCRRPVRLQGRITRVHDGKRTVAFDTKDLCDGVLLKACGSRRATVCPPCSAVYCSDAFHLVAAGLRGGKGVDERVSRHPAVMITLTAPSFGPVHRRGPDGGCHPRRRLCRHGNQLWCAKQHGEKDRLLGEALCPRCYDYRAAVLFNLSVSELWRRTTIYVLRALGEAVGMSVRTVESMVRLSYIKVVEFQRRGSVHVHAVVRLDSASKTDELPPSVYDGPVLAWAVATAVRKVHAPVAGDCGPGARRVRWGTQLDVVAITDHENGRARAAAYLAKYSTKTSDGSGLLDHRLRAGVPDEVDLSPQVRRLVATAWTLGGDPHYRNLRLRAWAHTLGFRGHFATKSRFYSTTFGALRSARRVWRVAQDGVSTLSHDDATVEDAAEWEFAGVGYSNRGEAWVAHCLAGRVREARRCRYEERIGQWEAMA